MKIKYEFKERFNYSKEAIIECQELNSIVFPSEYVLFLNTYGGSEFDDSNFTNGLSITIDKLTHIIPFAEFYSFEDLKYEIDDIREEDLFIDLCPLDRFLPIGSGHGQFRICIGIAEDNLNSIFLLDIEKEQMTKVCDSLQEFIDLHLVFPETLMDWD